MNVVRIGVALTCFNRREKTRSCLLALRAALHSLGGAVQAHVVVTNDGSTDGTLEMIQQDFSEVELIQGDGNLYWNGGMRASFGRLLDQKYDFYLWLNDDTSLFPESVGTLLKAHQEMQAETGKDGIVVGSTCDDAGKVTYGGMRRRSPLIGSLRCDILPPGDRPFACETHNGNCVLISAAAANILGNLDEAFTHSMGDMDYGFRASGAGIPIWVARGFIGRCERDHVVAKSFLDTSLPLRQRLKLITSVKNLQPRAWWVICKRHAGPLFPLHFAWPYFRTIGSSVFAKFSRGR